MPGYAVIDVETTGLSPFGMHRIWEFGAVLANERGNIEDKVEFQVRLLDEELAAADQKALDVGRFAERYQYSGAYKSYEAGRYMQDALRERIVIAQPALFDLTFVRAHLARHYQVETWSHRAVHDLKTWACAYDSTRELFAMQGGEIPAREMSTDELLKLAGIDANTQERHTALGDALLTFEAAKRLGAIPR